MAASLNGDGKKALGWMMLDPSMMFPTYFIIIGIIDARTGDALAYTQVRTTYDFGKEDDKKLVDILAGTLKKLPPGKPAEKK